MRDWSGALTISNMHTGDTLILSGDGVVTFDASCDGGVARIRGHWEITNSSTTPFVAITDTSVWNESQNVANVTVSALVSVGSGAGQINVSSGKVPATLAAGDGTDVTAIKTVTDKLGDMVTTV
jgi:hypothetical protein